MKAKRRKSVGSIHFKLKFIPDERRVDVRQKGRELFTNKKEDSVRRGRRTDVRTNMFMRFVKNSKHRQIRYSEENRFCRGVINRKRRAFSRFKFRIHSRGKIC